MDNFPGLLRGRTTTGAQAWALATTRGGGLAGAGGAGLVSPITGYSTSPLELCLIC